MTSVPPWFDPYLTTLGWTETLATSLSAADPAGSLRPGRVMGQGRGHYQVQASADGTFEAAITTKFHDEVKDAAGFPTVGDWVTFDFRDGTEQATIHHVLRRRNVIQRNRAGAAQDVQLIAANADVVLAVTSLEEDLDLEKLGRFVALGKHAHCTTVVVLAKMDLCRDLDRRVKDAKREFRGQKVYAISTDDAESLRALEPYFAPGRTAVLVGPSGAGKSTLTNHLLGFAAQKTQGVSANARGRHTTTARTLRPTRFGGLVMDTPGMQEVSVGEEGEALNQSFADVEDATLRCKFTSCRHENDPGCAIVALIKAGDLEPERWAKYLAAKAKSQRPARGNRPRTRR